jgi:hypothetical protein
MCTLTFFFTQKRVANTSTTSKEPKLQRFVQRNTTPASRVTSKQESVAKAGIYVLFGFQFYLAFIFEFYIYALFTIKGENINGPRRILSIQEKFPVVPPKSSTGAENSAAVSDIY